MTRPLVGFIGTGVMGRSMAANLLAAGYPLTVYNRTRARAESLLAAGATWSDSVSELAARADVVITIIGYPADVEAVYLGPGGVLDSARSGALAIDMTTSRPDLAQRIARVAAERGVAALDAPVSGGDIGAREARLSIMVGGDDQAFARARPLFEAMGKTIVLQGPAGAGQYTKMCNQIVIAASMMGSCEAMAYARAVGLDPLRVLDSIGSGAAACHSLNNLMPRALQGDLAPGFYVKHFLKDMTIAFESAAALGLALPGLTQARALYQRLVDGGGEDLGTQALLRLYE